LRISPDPTDPTRPTVKAEVNYPYQAVMLSSFPAPANPYKPEPNVLDGDGNFAVIETDECNPESLESSERCGPYSGPDGLGRQLAFNRTVRPFQKLITMYATELVPMGVMP
jgi:hypothetical protein